MEQRSSDDWQEKVKEFFQWYWQQLKQKVWLRWVTGIVVLLFLTAIFPGSEETGSTSNSKPAAASTTSNEPAQESPQEQEVESGSESEAPSRARKPKKLSSKQRVKESLSGADIKDVEFGNDELRVVAATPEGGFEGPSTADLNDSASEIFADIYGDAKWKKTPTVIVFKGGLVSTKTGKSKPNVNTGIFSMSLSDARDIDWSDEDSLILIDWSLYRDFAHPALKQED